MRVGLRQVQATEIVGSLSLSKRGVMCSGLRQAQAAEMVSSLSLSKRGVMCSGLRQAQATEIVGSLSLSKRGGGVRWPSTGSGCGDPWFAELVEAWW
jgi:hypothetical protein